MTDAATIRSWSWSPTASDHQIPVTDEIVRQRMDRDRELVERCLRGSDGAWEELVRNHTGLVYGTCYRFTGNAADAGDLTQDVFLRVFRSLHTYKASAGGFRTWLVKLTRNLLIDHYRRTKKEQRVDPLDEQIHAIEEKGGLGGQADRILRRREAGELLQFGLSQLSPELREAVILRDLQELEYREIAQALSIPEGTVKSRINRGRRELGRRLKAQGGGR